MWVKVAHPEIAAAHAACEAQRLVELGCPPNLGETELRWLKLADRLAAYAHVAHVRPDLLARFDWRETLAEVVAQAWQLGCEVGVEALIARLAPQLIGGEA